MKSRIILSLAASLICALTADPGPSDLLLNKHPSTQLNTEERQALNAAVTQGQAAFDAYLQKLLPQNAPTSIPSMPRSDTPKTQTPEYAQQQRRVHTQPKQAPQTQALQQLAYVQRVAYVNATGTHETYYESQDFCTGEGSNTCFHAEPRLIQVLPALNIVPIQPTTALLKQLDTILENNRPASQQDPEPFDGGCGGTQYGCSPAQAWEQHALTYAPFYRAYWDALNAYITQAYTLLEKTVSAQQPAPIKAGKRPLAPQKHAVS
jgi:hypothetical protein